MEPEVRRKPLRYYEIDLLRFLASVSVVIFHYTFQGFAQSPTVNPVSFPELSAYTRYGYLGVELFFIISGYVVLLSAQGKTIRQFFLSRLTRLYPAFWAACTLTAVVELVLGQPHMSDVLKPNPTIYLFNMTMMHGFLDITGIDGAYWSLTVEITFYFLISLLIGYKLLRHIDSCIALWLGYVVLHLLMCNPTAPFSVLFFPTYAPYFAAGMLFYLLQQPQGRSWVRYFLLLGSYVLSLKSAVSYTYELSRIYHTHFQPEVAAGAVTLFFLIFGLVAFRKLNLSRFTWLAWLGALTYPLYLIHSHIGYMIFHRLGHLLNKYLLVGGTFILMLGLAYLIHVLVEKRFSKPLGELANKWMSRLDR